MEQASNYEVQGQSAAGKGTNGPHLAPPPLLPPTRLKSNLKNKTILVEASNEPVRRTVTWPDAHGKAIAHIQEFEPSESEDAELEGVRNSCVCTIQ